jgi:hypothetical protein
MALRERQRSVDLADDLLWGVAEIASFIGKPLRQTYYLIERGALPVHRPTGRTGRTIIARKSEIQARLSGGGDE